MLICTYIDREINKQKKVFEQESYMITPTFQRLTAFVKLELEGETKGEKIIRTLQK